MYINESMSIRNICIRKSMSTRNRLSISMSVYKWDLSKYDKSMTREKLTNDNYDS